MKVSVSNKYMYTVFAEDGFKFIRNEVLNELTWDEVETLNFPLDGKVLSFESTTHYQLTEKSWKNIFNKHQVPE